jgi:hypothetical protein
MVDTELAWDLADVARGHLDAGQRDAVYIGIAAGDAFWAVAFLLQTIVRAGLIVRADLMPKLLRWVVAYEYHPEQAHLRHLIGRVRIQRCDPPRAILVQKPGLATLSVRRPRPAPSPAVATYNDLRR